MDGGIIEMFITKVVEELGATGVLVVGLYFLLSRPLTAISSSLKKVDKRLCAIIHMKERSKDIFSEAAR